MSQEGKYQNSPDPEVISKPQRRRYTAEYNCQQEVLQLDEKLRF
jgi:hypothetical protein